MGASLLRLHFHDCFVNGCDASLLLDDAATFKGEKTSAANANSLRGFEVIDNIKAELESLCPNMVSCADILAVAARDSIVALGGPTYTVALGRRDSTAANVTATEDLPSPFVNVTKLIAAFSKKGFTVKEMVALSGAHTIGQARCALFRGRLYNDTDINASFAAAVRAKCPGSGGSGDNNMSELDVTTPTTFDSSYFKNVMSQKGLLHSDQQLYSGGFTKTAVDAYAKNAASFMEDFAEAMNKMGRLSPLTGSIGQIRTNCRKVN
ncbi:cationic peroxidase 1-like [Prunus dulcis]|nr:cationic peroxidase 1-like [Prunus dulcis]